MTWKDWLGLIAAAPEIWPHVKAILKILRDRRIGQDDEPAADAPHISPKEILTKAHSISAEEERTFSRHGAE